MSGTIMDQKKLYKNLIYNTISVALVVLAVLVFKSILIVTVDGDSMIPNYKNNQKVIAIKNKQIKRFDVIVFDAEHVDPKYTTTDGSKYYIKRVVGLPGDEITYSPEGDLYINHKKVAQKFIDTKTRTIDTLDMSGKQHADGFTLDSLSSEMNWKYKPINNKVPKNEYFVLGDNRSISNDSRYYGLVPKSQIKGNILNTKDSSKNVK